MVFFRFLFTNRKLCIRNIWTRKTNIPVVELYASQVLRSTVWKGTMVPLNVNDDPDVSGPRAEKAQDAPERK